jgi:hypothetical protein
MVLPSVNGVVHILSPYDRYILSQLLDNRDTLSQNGAMQLEEWRETWKAEARRQHGHGSLKWLAAATNTPVQTIYAYSRGRRRPPDRWLLSAAGRLGKEVTG